MRCHPRLQVSTWSFHTGTDAFEDQPEKSTSPKGIQMALISYEAGIMLGIFRAHLKQAPHRAPSTAQEHSEMEEFAIPINCRAFY